MNQLARQLSFFAPAAVMSAWAVVMFHTVATGRINHLLIPLFRNYVIIAAVVLAILSALYLLLYQPTTETAPALAPTGRLRQFGRWLVLLVPLVAASILSPSALSSTTMANRSATAGIAPLPTMDQASQAKAKEAIDSNPNQPAAVDVTDLISISQRPAQIQSFEGRTVQSVGLFSQEAGGAPKLVRWIMWCCAADAQPASVELTGNITGTWKDSQWVEVTGKAHFPSTLGHAVPQIEVQSIAPTQEPDEPYLSP